ncbi:MAG TPA: hypothetical protein GXX75_05625 [Clostridiales bacterium]|nr:hypothetical protein [Clostridiales bacterium]
MIRIKKKYLALLLVISTLFMGWSSPALAKEKNDTTLDTLSRTPMASISEDDFEEMKTDIDKMSDKEFDDYLTKFISEEPDQNKAKAKLEKIGVKVDFQQKDQYTLQQLYPGNITLTSYSAHRGHDPYYRLYCSISNNGYAEDRPATYDVVGMFFNSNMASYYGTNVSDSYYVWLKDSSQFSNGTILFNCDDNRFGLFTPTQYVAVYVTPNQSGYFVYGSKYVHTFNTTSISTSGSATVTFSGTGVNGSIGFVVHQSTVETNWEKGSDNAITW